MSNVEVMYSACRELLCRTVYFKKRLSKAKPSFEILRFNIRYSAVRGSIQAIGAADLIIKKLCYFGVVSYKDQGLGASSLNDRIVPAI